jgi:hypothetical protein
MQHLAVVHGMSHRMMKNYYGTLKNYWRFMRSELEEVLASGSGLSAAGRQSLSAYLDLLQAIESTGFIEIKV